MGSTFYNFHVRTTDVARVREAIEATASIAWVAAEPQNGWVSVYPYRCEARAIAEQTQLPVLYLSEYDGDIAQYELFENGICVDTFDSAPDCWVGSSDGSPEPINPKTSEELASLAGNPDLLLPYCVPGTQRDEIVAALGKTLRDCLLANAEVTGIPPDTEKMLTTSFLDRLDSGMVLGALEDVLGLSGRLLYSGLLRIFGAEEEEVALEFVGSDQLTQADKNNFLCQSIPDTRIVPYLGLPLESYLYEKLAAMRLWISQGANPNEDDGLGYPFSIPLLMQAVSGNCPEAVEILLEAGANPNVSITREVSRHGNVTLTPAALAAQAERKDEILVLLARFGA